MDALLCAISMDDKNEIIGTRAGAPTSTQDRVLPDSPVFDENPDGTITPDKAQSLALGSAPASPFASSSSASSSRKRKSSAIAALAPEAGRHGSTEARSRVREAGNDTSAPRSKKAKAYKKSRAAPHPASTTNMLHGISFEYNPPPTLHVSGLAAPPPPAYDFGRPPMVPLMKGDRTLTFVLGAGSDEGSKQRRLRRLNILRSRRTCEPTARKATDAEIRRKIQNRMSAKLARERHRDEFQRLKEAVKLLEKNNGTLLEENVALRRILSMRGVKPGDCLLPNEQAAGAASLPGGGGNETAHQESLSI